VKSVKSGKKENSKNFVEIMSVQKGNILMVDDNKSILSAFEILTPEFGR
jgi:predicted ribosome quality control (RQC) complex YloA/Tae2 family protein